MGKKKRAKLLGPKAVWDTAEEAALLGLLDFCIKHKHAFPFNEETVVDRLRFTGNRDSTHTYTWGQINRKLDHIWRNFGRNDSPTKTDIYVKGSLCLAGFEEHEWSAIKLEAERLEKRLKPVW
jgi:hypothetical protein